MNTYDPQPIDTSDIELPSDLIELTEQLAENVHDIWAYRRLKEGRKIGEKRDDVMKIHPNLIPYSQLEESEKEYDREAAIQSIKFIISLGYKIKKKKGSITNSRICRHEFG